MIQKWISKCQLSEPKSDQKVVKSVKISEIADQLGCKYIKIAIVEGDDLLPEVVIGRISANGTSELYNIINKTIAYEKAHQQIDLGWYDRAGLDGDPTTSGLSCAITNQYIDQLAI